MASVYIALGQPAPAVNGRGGPDGQGRTQDRRWGVSRHPAVNGMGSPMARGALRTAGGESAGTRSQWQGQSGWPGAHSGSVVERSDHAGFLFYRTSRSNDGIHSSHWSLFLL